MLVETKLTRFSSVFRFVVVCCIPLSAIANTDKQEIMSQRSGSIDIRSLQDIYTPTGERLSGIYKKSFAYKTIKDRLPVILTKVIDTLSRNKDAMIQLYGEDASQEIKQIVGFISMLKNEIVTNKTLKPIVLLPKSMNSSNDAEVWNKYLEERENIEGEIPTWFNTIWLYCECYMYRTLAQAFLLTNTLKTYDSFEEQKRKNFIDSLSSINILSEHIMTLKHSKESISTAQQKQEIFRLLQLSLWSNRCDLSLSAGSDNNQSGNPIQVLESLKNNILVDESECIWKLINPENRSNSTVIVDFVLDNAGYELFTDLCLASLFIIYGLADKIRFYVKCFPWYVSDTTYNDFHWTLEYMNNSSNLKLQTFAKLCSDYLMNKTWIIEGEQYWTSPYEYATMKTHDPILYAKLSEAKLVIFKGDLNYRKLLGDINWDYTTRFREALRDFKPTHIVSLRTIKSDVCVGLPKGKGKTLFETDENWMIMGDYGLIQANCVRDCHCDIGKL